MKRSTAILFLVSLVALACQQPAAVPGPKFGASYSGTSPTGWVTVQQQRAMVFMGVAPDKLGGLEFDFARTATSEGYVVSVVGSGAGTQVAALGGRLDLSTGATASSNARVVSSTLTVAPKTERFYLAVRARLVTTSDAQTITLFGVNNTLASDNVNLVLTSEALKLRLRASGVDTNVTLTWTVEHAAYHDFAIGFDLTTVRAFVDNIQVGSTTTLTNSPTLACNLDVTVQNGSTTANQQVLADKAVLYVRAP